jgi:hypothetical protein
VISLKFNHDADRNLSFYSEKGIKELGSILLTKNLDETGNTYVGIALLKEKTGPTGAQVEYWVLHLCSMDREPTEFNLDVLMPAAIQALKEQRIIPNCISREIGNPINPIMTYNFQNWQKNAATMLGF